MEYLFKEVSAFLEVELSLRHTCSEIESWEGEEKRFMIKLSVVVIQVCECFILKRTALLVYLLS